MFNTLDKQKILESLIAGAASLMKELDERIAAMQKEIDDLRGVKPRKNNNKVERTKGK